MAVAIFGVIGRMGVAVAIGLCDRSIILRPLVNILDPQADRRARRLALEHPLQDTHLVGFLPLRCVTRLARAPLVEEGLDIGFGERQPRRTAVNDGAERGTVAFPPSGEAKNAPEAVETHKPLSPWGREIGRAHV